MNRAPRTGARVRSSSFVALGSGLALSFAFPTADLGWLGLIALAPLLWLWHDASPRRGAWLGFVAGIGFFSVHLAWTWYFGAIAIVPLVALQAGFWAAAGGVVGMAARRGVRSPFLTAAI